MITVLINNRSPINIAMKLMNTNKMMMYPARVAPFVPVFMVLLEVVVHNRCRTRYAVQSLGA